MRQRTSPEPCSFAFEEAMGQGEVSELNGGPCLCEGEMNRQCVCLQKRSATPPRSASHRCVAGRLVSPLRQSKEFLPEKLAPIPPVCVADELPSAEVFCGGTCAPAFAGACVSVGCARGVVSLNRESVVIIQETHSEHGCECVSA